MTSDAARSEGPLVEVRAVSVDFYVAATEWLAHPVRLRAIDRVSFEIRTGETLALVGESGCGKTTVGRTLLRLYDPSEGQILFEGTDLADLSRSGLRGFRRHAQMIFQDPYASLNPRMKVEDVIAEPLRMQGVRSAERHRRVGELLALVGLPEQSRTRFPHAFSGGQRQRIGIARALALQPNFVVADEPVSALDVSIQAQVVNLLMDLQVELGLTLLFIAHDLAVVRQIATRVAVMYLGKLVELASRDAFFDTPLHPYSQALLSAVPVPDPRIERGRERIVLSGEVPSPVDPPAGCRFHTRCLYSMEQCRVIEPELRLAGDGRLVACHLVHPPTGTGANDA